MNVWKRRSDVFKQFPQETRIYINKLDNYTMTSYCKILSRKQNQQFGYDTWITFSFNGIMIAWHLIIFLNVNNLDHNIKFNMKKDA